MGKRSEALKQAQEQRDLESHQWWDYACGVARELATGHPPPTVSVHGVVLNRDEAAYLMTQGGYARFYAAGDGSWSSAGMFVVGRPAVVAGAALGNAIANSRARSAAAAAATPMWREHQQTGVLATSQRLLCYSAGQGKWLSFWFAGVTEFYPDLENWTVTLVFEKGAPLRISGPQSVAIAVWAAHGILGDNWRKDPRLARLLPHR